MLTVGPLQKLNVGDDLFLLVSIFASDWSKKEYHQSSVLNGTQIKIKKNAVNKSVSPLGLLFGIFVLLFELFSSGNLSNSTCGVFHDTEASHTRTRAVPCRRLLQRARDPPFSAQHEARRPLAQGTDHPWRLKKLPRPSRTSSSVSSLFLSPKPHEHRPCHYFSLRSSIAVCMPVDVLPAWLASWPRQPPPRHPESDVALGFSLTLVRYSMLSTICAIPR